MFQATRGRPGALPGRIPVPIAGHAALPHLCIQMCSCMVGIAGLLPRQDIAAAEPELLERGRFRAGEQLGDSSTSVASRAQLLRTFWERFRSTSLPCSWVPYCEFK